jgi:hypothetical protein
MQAGRKERDVRVMDKSVQRMLRLIDQLLEFRKMQAGKLKLSLQETDAVMFVKGICRMFDDAAESKKIAYSFESSEPAHAMFLVPCPFPVVRKLPYNKIRAETGCSPSSFRLIYPIFTAPAVWELDGPTITGPTTSNIFIASLSFFCIMRFLPSNYVKHTIET